MRVYANVSGTGCLPFAQIQAALLMANHVAARPIKLSSISLNNMLRKRSLLSSLCVCVCVQVLGEVFNCLHRAQVGSAATGGLDPQLPQLVRVPTASSSGSLSALPTPPDPTPRHHCASSMAQDVFGQKVQVVCLVYDGQPSLGCWLGLCFSCQCFLRL